MSSFKISRAPYIARSVSRLCRMWPRYSTQNTYLPRTSDSSSWSKCKGCESGFEYLHTCSKDPRKSKTSRAILPEAVPALTQDGGKSCTRPLTCRIPVECWEYRALRERSTSDATHGTFIQTRQGKQRDVRVGGDLSTACWRAVRCSRKAFSLVSKDFRDTVNDGQIPRTRESPTCPRDGARQHEEYCMTFDLARNDQAHTQSSY